MDNSSTPTISVKISAQARDGLGQTKAIIVVAVRCRIPIAIRHAQIPRIIVPSPAAQHTATNV